MVQVDPTSGAWSIPGASGNPWAGDYDGRPDYLRTIQPADIDGDGHDEVIGRSVGGMYAFPLGIQGDGYIWRGSYSPGSPALVDDPWKDPQYYETISTARLDPNSPGRSLIARGPHGIRTWTFDTRTSSWERPKPYGSFPAVDAAALSALDAYLGIARGTIRDVYTDPSRDPTADQLQAFQADIERTCSGPISASPPRYTSCQPPPSASGVSPAAWTAVSNQIMAELFWARQVVDHFTTLNDIQTALFLDEDAEFPSLAADLRLAQASGAVKPEGADTAEIFEGVLEILGTIAELVPGAEELGPIFDITAAAIGIGVAATPKVSEERGPSELDHSFADVQRTIATIRQQTQDAIEAHRRYVTADYGLLSTVGHLVSAQVWTLDKQAAVSAGRQRFTGWMYEEFLPVLWDRWHVANCGSDFGCPLPPQGPLVRWSPDPSFPDPTRNAAFDAVVPKQLPCHAEFLNPVAVCHWTTLDEQGYAGTVQTLTSEVTAACRYDPRAGTSWRYGSCGLGIPVEEVLTGAAPWSFNHVTCDFDVMRGVFDPALGADCIYPNVTVPTTASALVGHATGVGTDQAKVRLSVEHPIEGPIDLRGAKVKLGRLLHEGGPGGAKELVGHPNGGEIVPDSHRVTDDATRRHAVFIDRPANGPRIRGILSVEDGVLSIDLRIRRVALDVARSCDGRPSTGHLGHHLIVKDGKGRFFQLVVMAPWQCFTDRDGSPRLQYPPERLGRGVPMP